MGTLGILSGATLVQTLPGAFSLHDTADLQQQRRVTGSDPTAKSLEGNDD